MFPTKIRPSGIVAAVSMLVAVFSSRPTPLLAQDATVASVKFTSTHYSPSDTLSDVTYFTFVGSGELGLDRSDAYSLTPYTYTTRLLAMSYPIGAQVGELKALDIQNLPIRPADQIRVPLDILYLNFTTAFESQAQEVQLTWERTNVSNASLQIGLYDTVQDTTIDLMADGTYTFTTRARGTLTLTGNIYPVIASPRFELVATDLKTQHGTSALAAQTSRTAVLTDSLLYDGSSGILSHGICYNTTGAPTLGTDPCTDRGAVQGALPYAFRDTLTGLTPATRYHARTVSVNATDTVYGGEQTFTTGVAGRTVSVASSHYLLSSPVSGTVLSTLLDPLWTQGMANADYAGGSPNVWTWDGSVWNPVADLATEPVAAGQGVLVFVYGDTDFDGVADLPVEVSVNGLERTDDVQIPTVHRTDATGGDLTAGWNLTGNPFSYPIDTDLMGLGKVMNPGYDPVVYGYNPAISDWESWNGEVGTLLGGEIPPYTGFLVRTTSEASPALSIPASARVLDNQAKAVSSDLAQADLRADSQALRLTLEDPETGRSDDLFIQFSSSGRMVSDPLDAPKLQSPSLKNRPLAASFAPADPSTEGAGTLAHEIQHLPRPGVGEAAAAYSLPVSVLWLEGAEQAGKSAPGVPFAPFATGERSGESTGQQTGQQTGQRSGPIQTSAARDLALTWTWMGRDPAGAEDMRVTLRDRESGRKIDLSAPGVATIRSTAGIEVMPGFAYDGLRSDRFELLVEAAGTAVSTDPGNDPGTDPLPSELRLHPNVPNPFNPSTLVRFSLPAADRVTLRVYDPSGRLVDVLLSEQAFQQGDHAVRFNGEALPSGVYLLVLQASSGQRSVRSLTLLK